MRNLIAAAFFGLTASAAQAAVVNFDFTGPRGNVPTLTSTSDGRSMTATPTTNQLRVNNAGIGVTTNPEGGRLGAGESIVFTGPGFNRLSISIWETGSEDEQFRVTIGGSTYDFTISGGSNGSSIVTFDIPAPILVDPVDVFTVTGLTPNGPGNRGVRVAGVTINAVPLPATSAMLALGLVGFGAMRRRKSI